MQAASKKKKIALPPGMAKGMAAEFAPIASNIYQCMDLACLCSYLRGTANGAGCTLPNGQPLQKSLRKEYRMLTDDERNRLHAAFRGLKNVWNRVKFQLFLFVSERRIRSHRQNPLPDVCCRRCSFRTCLPPLAQRVRETCGVCPSSSGSICEPSLLGFHPGQWTAKTCRFDHVQ